MTDTQKQDRELQEYLAGRSRLSQVYQHLQTGEPDAETDRAILAAAQQKPASRTTFRRWFIPAAIAALFMLGASAVIWQQYAFQPAEHNAAAPSPSNRLPQQVEGMLHDNPAADQWLERILKLHQEEKTARAAKEFEKFRQAYPAYSIDAERFGALLQYDKSQ